MFPPYSIISIVTESEIEYFIIHTERYILDGLGSLKLLTADNLIIYKDSIY